VRLPAVCELIMKSTVVDLTEKHRPAGTGMDTKLLFMCGHKALSTGGTFKGRLPMLCINCKKEPK
jgi:hypothetical protein